MKVVGFGGHVHDNGAAKAEPDCAVVGAAGGEGLPAALPDWILSTAKRMLVYETSTKHRGPTKINTEAAKMTSWLSPVSAQASLSTDRISQKKWLTSRGPQKGSLRTTTTRARAGRKLNTQDV